MKIRERILKGELRTMDISKIISEIAEKLSGNKDLISGFLKDPATVIKSLTGLDIDASKIGEIVKGVKELLGGQLTDVLGNAGETVKQGKSFLDKIKGFFKK